MIEGEAWRPGRKIWVAVQKSAKVLGHPGFLHTNLALHISETAVTTRLKRRE